MRNLMITMLLFCITGCINKQYTDKRPADQVRFIDITREWRDTINAAGENESLRYQLLENGVKAIKTHIADSLRLQFQSWEARVLNVAPDPTDRKFTIASFGMNLDHGEPSEQNRYQSVVFTISTSEPEQTYKTINNLKVGDMIRIDGSFKTLQKTIDIDSYNRFSKSKNVLDNPEFRVEVNKVEKL